MATPIITPEKIEFTEAQQAHIQKLFDTRFASISTKKEEEVTAAKAETARVAKELEDLRKKVPTVEAPPTAHASTEEKEQMAALLRSEQSNTQAAKTAWEKEKERADSLAAVNSEILKTQAIHAAASNLENGLVFHDLPMVTELVKRSIVLDKDTNQYVVKINGVVKMNKSLQPMTLPEYFMEYATQRPYLVKSQVKPGSGSQESISGGQGEIGIIRTKADLNRGTVSQTVAAKSAYITKFGLEQYSKLPTK